MELLNKNFNSEQNKNGDLVKPVLADEEYLPLQEHSVDLIVSNLALHWVNELPECLSQVRKALQPDGIFLASTFGLNTLQELRDSFTVAEQERESGLSPHVSPFARISDIGNLLGRAGFSLPTGTIILLPLFM